MAYKMKVALMAFVLAGFVGWGPNFSSAERAFAQAAPVAPAVQPVATPAPATPAAQPVATPAPATPAAQPVATPAPATPAVQPVATPAPATPAVQPVATPAPATPAAQPVATPAPVAPAAQPVATPAATPADDSAVPAPAQEKAATPDLCSAVHVTAATAIASSGPGFPDEGFDVDATQPSADEPQPANPVQKVCENGRIKIQVGAKREFGHRIGDVAEVRVLIVTDANVLIDFRSLTQAHALAYGGSDVVLAKDNPISLRRVVQGEHVIYLLELRLQTFVIKAPGVQFSLDLRYATDMVAATKTPDWKVLSTPSFLITRSNTVDNGTELDEGDLSNQNARTPWIMWPALVGGFFLLMLWPGLLIVNRLNILRPKRKIPVNEIAWRKLDRTLADAREFGWQQYHYKQVAASVRIGLGYQPQTRLEILDRVRNNPELAPKYAQISSVLSMLDDVLYNERVLTRAETESLIRQLPEILKRPQ